MEVGTDKDLTGQDTEDEGENMSRELNKISMRGLTVYPKCFRRCKVQQTATRYAGKCYMRCVQLENHERICKCVHHIIEEKDQEEQCAMMGEEDNRSKETQRGNENCKQN